MANAISVEIGIPVPLIKPPLILKRKYITAGNTIPPTAATIGNNASLIFDKFPYTNSLFISSPTTKKNIAIKKSLIIPCRLNSPIIFILNNILS